MGAGNSARKYSECNWNIRRYYSVPALGIVRVAETAYQSYAK